MKSPLRKKNGGKRIDEAKYRACSKVVRDMMALIESSGHSVRSIAAMAGTHSSTISGYSKKAPRLEIIEACLNAMGYALVIVKQDDDDMKEIVSSVLAGVSYSDLADKYGYESTEDIVSAVSDFMKTRRIERLSNIKRIV